MNFFLVFSLCVVISVADRDYYSVLNLNRGATRHEIKKQYRALAKQFHPDMNKNDPEADIKFRELAEAYQVLSDPEKRERYDTHGKEGLNNEGFNDNVFDSFFGRFGFSFGHGEERDEVKRGNDVTLDLSVTLEELYVGYFVEISRVKMDRRNTPGTRKCRCRMKMVQTQRGPGQFEIRQVESCDECPNVRFEKEERHLEVEIEQGMRDGQIYPFVSEGEPDLDGEPGDLKFRIRQQLHRYYQRRGDDLYTNITITLVQSIVGFHFTLTHLDGHLVTIKSYKLTPPGTIIRKPGEGMPNYENARVYGSLYIAVDVAYPNDRQLTEEERSKIMTIFTDTNSSTHPSDAIPLTAPMYNGLDNVPGFSAPKVTS